MIGIYTEQLLLAYDRHMKMATAKRTLNITSIVVPFGNETTFTDVVSAFTTIAAHYANELSNHRVLVRHSTQAIDQAHLAGQLNLNTDVLLPAHASLEFGKASHALIGTDTVVIGINGGSEIIESNPNAFNIGVQDNLSQARAVAAYLGLAAGGRRVVNIGSTAQSNIQISNELSDDNLVKSICAVMNETAQPILVLDTDNIQGARVSAALKNSDFHGTVIRIKGSAFAMPPHVEVIDIVGSFVDLATVEFTDLIERALGRPATGALLRDLMTLAWRLDAICLAVAAINSEPLLPLGSTIAQFTTSTQIISGPTRRISFDSKRMNTQRCALIVRRPPGATSGHLHPLQFAQDGSVRCVAYTSCTPLWIGDIVEKDGSFAADFLVDLSSSSPLDPDMVTFLNACESPEVQAQINEDCGLHTMHLRVRGKFRFDTVIKNYPFDEQRLGIMMSITKNQEDFLIQPRELPTVDSCAIEGWRILRSQLGRNTDCLPQPRGAQGIAWIERDSVVFSVRIARKAYDSFTRTVVPLALILILVWCTGFWNDPGQVSGLLINAFVTCVALYFTEPKPVPGRSTFVDRMFLVCNALIGIKLASSVACFGFEDPNYAMMILNRASLVIFPVVLLVSIIIIRPRQKK